MRVISLLSMQFDSYAYYISCIMYWYVVGAKSLKKAGATEIEVENFGDFEGF